MDSDDSIPITHDNCQRVEGPFYHGTKASLVVGDLLVAGHSSNFEEGRTSNHIYFSARLEAAIWGAELAMSLSGQDGRGHIYIVQPSGPFEDDPNVTNKRFPGEPDAVVSHARIASCRRGGRRLAAPPGRGASSHARLPAELEA